LTSPAACARACPARNGCSEPVTEPPLTAEIRSAHSRVVVVQTDETASRQALASNVDRARRRYRPLRSRAGRRARPSGLRGRERQGSRPISDLPASAATASHATASPSAAASCPSASYPSATAPARAVAASGAHTAPGPSTTACAWAASACCTPTACYATPASASDRHDALRAGEDDGACAGQDSA
jgi:hypothetical protein